MKPRNIVTVWSDGMGRDRGWHTYEIVRRGDMATVYVEQLIYYGA